MCFNREKQDSKFYTVIEIIFQIDQKIVQVT